jgi:hypothetical protein
VGIGVKNPHFHVDLRFPETTIYQERIVCRPISKEQSMKYMLLIYTDETSWTEGEREHCFAESTKLTHELHQQGKYLGASPLHPVTTATSVRVREGRRQVTDGPFAETREQLGGFFLIEAANLDDAIDIAGRIPGAMKGTVEVRPVLELEGLPSV